MTESNTQFKNEYVYDWNWNDEQRAVVKLIIGEKEWFIDYDEFVLAESEGRTKPVIYKENLILVDDETFTEFQNLSNWIKQNNN